MAEIEFVQVMGKDGKHHLGLSMVKGGSISLYAPRHFPSALPAGDLKGSEILTKEQAAERIIEKHGGNPETLAWVKPVIMSWICCFETSGLNSTTISCHS